MRAKGRLSFIVLLVSGVCSTATAGDGFANLRGWADFRSAYSTADREWLDGGFSKTRYGSVDGEGVDAELAEASLEWTPTWGAAWSGHFHLQGTPDQDSPLGPVEAFVAYRPLPKAGWRLSARAGRYFPLVSLEHDGPGWGVTRTITPSSINSWIGEEVAVTGVEMRAGRAFGDHRIDFNVGVFGFNDTAGALLAYRGWALHDVKTMIGGSFQIPDREDRRLLLPDQDERTRPFQELDGRIGLNASVKWRYADAVTVLLSAYDNRADPLALQDGQYGWATRYVNLGVKYEPNDCIDVIAQGLYGETAMGPPSTAYARRLFDLEYYSAFVMASRRTSASHVLAARLDYFATQERGDAAISEGENGWAATLSARWRLADGVEAGAEKLYVDTDGGNDPTSTKRVRDVQLIFRIRIGF